MKFLKSLNEYFYEEIKDVPRINFEKILEIIGVQPPKKEFDEDDINLLKKIGFYIKSNKEVQGSYRYNIITIYLKNDTYYVKIVTPTDEYEYTKKKTLRESLNHLRSKLKIKKLSEPHEISYDEYPPINLNNLPILSYGYSTYDSLSKNEENNPNFSPDDIKKLKYIGFDVDVNNNEAKGKLSIKLYGEHRDKHTDKKIKDFILKINKTKSGYKFIDDNNNYSLYLSLNDVLFKIKYRFWTTWYKTGRIIKDTSKFT
jgi:hypothetical protein